MSALQNFPHYAIYCIYDILPHLSASLMLASRETGLPPRCPLMRPPSWRIQLSVHLNRSEHSRSTHYTDAQPANASANKTGDLRRILTDKLPIPASLSNELLHAFP